MFQPLAAEPVSAYCKGSQLPVSFWAYEPRVAPVRHAAVSTLVCDPINLWRSREKRVGDIAGRVAAPTGFCRLAYQFRIIKLEGSPTLRPLSPPSPTLPRIDVRCSESSQLADDFKGSRRNSCFTNYDTDMQLQRDPFLEDEVLQSTPSRHP